MNYKHGLAHSRIDSIYKSMKDRCYNPNNKRYKSYGGRGIKICSLWLENKNAFFEWASSQGYDSNLPRGCQTLDRIDVNGDYSPENCRFISIEEQENNRTNNRRITYNGENHTVREWEKIKGFKRGTLHSRLSRMNVEKAMQNIPR